MPRPPSSPCLAALFAAALLVLGGCGFDDQALETGEAPAEAPAAAPASLAALAVGEPAAPPPGGGASLVGRTKPLMVIRFEDPDVDYQDELFAAVGGALERRPTAGFDVVAVSPGYDPAGSERIGAQAAEVARSLTDDGAAGHPGEPVGDHRRPRHGRGGPPLRPLGGRPKEGTVTS